MKTLQNIIMQINLFKKELSHSNRANAATTYNSSPKDASRQSGEPFVKFRPLLIRRDD